jgi:hypothetical protein
MPRLDKLNHLDQITYGVSDLLVPYLIKLKIHPNLVTLFSFVFIYLIYISIIKKSYLLVFIYSFINYFFDCLDGELARKSGKTSKIGGILDTLHDCMSYFFMIYPIFKLYTIIIFLVGSIFAYQSKFDFVTHESNNENKRVQKFHLFFVNYIGYIYIIIGQIIVLIYSMKHLYI